MSFETRNRLREDYDSLMDLYRRISLIHKQELAGELVSNMCGDERVELFKHFISKVADNKFGNKIKSIDVNEEAVPFISDIKFLKREYHIHCEEDFHTTKIVVIRLGDISINTDGSYMISNVDYDASAFPSNFWEWTDDHHVYYKMAFL